ncbi:tetratricopeptide repeat protein [Bizionia sediminis]|uniref:Tetratricopeptide repeat protein n=1 Tax=Bizionia sediminis TaxID=1737064 RepID=A0ABW5KUD0_9FLAO
MKQFIVYIFACISAVGFSQEKASKEQLHAAKNANNLVFEANSFIEQDDFVSAEMAYRKAISEAPTQAIGAYNLGTANIKQGNYDEALYQLQKTLKTATSKPEKHRIFHNIGNILMANKKCKEAVEAYKNALRNNPADNETRYNLALAKECAKNQEEQNQNQDQDQDQDNDNKDQEDNQEEEQKDDKDGNQKDQQDQGDQDKKEGDKNPEDEGNPKDADEDSNKDEQKDGNGKEEQPQKPQPKPGQMSPQQMKNLLEAMNNQEAKVQEKINAQKEKGVKVQSEKDW